MTMEGVAPSRTFPTLTFNDGEMMLRPVQVDHPEWSDPAANFRELAEFSDPEMMGVWDDIHFTTTDLIFQVCENFDDFFDWFVLALQESLDDIREAALLMSDLQSRYEWVEKLNMKVLIKMLIKEILKKIFIIYKKS